MKILNCQRCRRPFVSEGSKLCPTCIDEENSAFDTIRAYLDDHPKAGLYQISADTGIDEEIVVNLIRRGRLRSVEKHLTRKCARCGAEVLIVDGDFCDRCQRELKTKVTKAIQQLSWKADSGASDRLERSESKPDERSKDSGMFIRDIRRKKDDSD